MGLLQLFVYLLLLRDDPMLSLRSRLRGATAGDDALLAVLTSELLELRARPLGRTRAAFAVQWDCCSCSCCCCTPFPACVL